MDRPRPRVLLIAEAANPDWVSVPLIGWSLSRALAEVADVHLVTQVRNRAAILARGLEEGLEEGRDFTAIDTEPVTRPIWRMGQALRGGKGKGWTTTAAVGALTYPYFEHLVWRRFGAEIRAGAFDIVHRITPVSPTTVSPIAKKCARAGVPFVMGPLNGGVPWPAGFDAERRREREWLSYVRGAYRALPGRRGMLGASAAILAGSRHTASEIPARYRDRVVYIPENAIDPKRFSRVAGQGTEGPLRAVFVGRLVPYKGADMALEAAAPLLAAGRMTYDIVGDGPARGDLEALVAGLGAGDAVTFHGNLPHEAVQDRLAAAHILLFPSIREFGGGVVLEAMATGVVPLIVDYAGPGELVTPGTGIAVPIGSREAIVAALRDRLGTLAEDRGALAAMGAAARDRIGRDFTWAAKARQIAEVYDWVGGRRAGRPAPFAGPDSA